MPGETKRARGYSAKAAWLLALAFELVAASAGAQAAPPLAASRPRFGEPGQWVLLGSSNALLLSNETFSNSGAKFFNSRVAVGVDRFIVRGLSIGWDIGAGYFIDRGYGATTLSETKGESISGGVRFGFNVPLGEFFSWYPRLTLGLHATHSDTTTLSATAGAPFPPPSSQSSIGPWLNLYAPFLIHLAPHFVAGFGPRLQHDFAVARGGPYNGSQSNLVSAELVVGGWWGGPAPEGAPQPKQVEPFGAKGHLVLTDAASASAAFVTYSKSKGSSTSFDVEPSVDYFVVNNVSLGVGVFFTHGSGTSLDSTGSVTNRTSESFGVAPRLGELVELTQNVACWPQVGLGFGTAESSQSSTSGTNHHARTRSWVKLSLPFLVHAASHFFVGAGPYFFHELSDNDQNGYENDATDWGISLLLGGWL